MLKTELSNDVEELQQQVQVLLKMLAAVTEGKAFSMYDCEGNLITLVFGLIGRGDHGAWHLPVTDPMIDSIIERTIVALDIYDEAKEIHDRHYYGVDNVG